MTSARTTPCPPAARGLLLGALLAVCAIIGVACAPLPQPGMAPAPSQQTSQARPDPTAGGPSTPVPPVPASTDSGPSAEALAVLKSIEEPLPPGERDDSLSTSGELGVEVPVPAPTYPLGLEPQAAPDTTLPPEASPDSGASGHGASAGSSAATGASGSAAGSGATAAGGAAAVGGAAAASGAAASSAVPSGTAPAPSKPSSSAAAPDTCWRVQISAPTAREKAESLRKAAESLLLIPMVVEPSKKVFKVITRDCWDGAAADRVKERAITSGFSGSFRFPKKTQ